MTELNPYRNTSTAILEAGASGNTKDFLKRKIKDEEFLKIVMNIIEFRQHIAFNEGRCQGKFEASQDLKKLIDVEDPEFLDANNEFYF